MKRNFQKVELDKVQVQVTESQKNFDKWKGLVSKLELDEAYNDALQGLVEKHEVKLKDIYGCYDRLEQLLTKVDSEDLLTKYKGFLERLRQKITHFDADVAKRVQNLERMKKKTFDGPLEKSYLENQFAVHSNPWEPILKLKRDHLVAIDGQLKQWQQNLDEWKRLRNLTGFEIPGADLRYRLGKMVEDRTKEFKENQDLHAQLQQSLPKVDSEAAFWAFQKQIGCLERRLSGKLKQLAGFVGAEQEQLDFDTESRIHSQEMQANRIVN